MTGEWPLTIRQRGIALFVPSLQFGGAERSTVDLANALARQGMPVHLIVINGDGPYRQRVAPAVTLVDLRSGRVLRSILPLARYLAAQRPAALISALDHTNIVALIAARLSGAPIKTVVTLRGSFSGMQVDTAGRAGQLPPQLVRLFYRHASAVVAVSEGVADDYAEYVGIPRHAMRVIYNPVISDRTLQAAGAPFSHPWFRPGEPPVLLSVGRLTAIKDFGTLLQAFALVRQKQPCRLMILGDGELRSQLEELAQSLQLDGDVALPGFAENPQVYMARAAVYVLSSVAEGLPGALIEALACGAPVVATDCPSGPREVLADGQFGPLVPLRDPAALAAAIESVLRSPLDRHVLQARANLFSEANSLAQYQALLTELVLPS